MKKSISFLSITVLVALILSACSSKLTQAEITALKNRTEAEIINGASDKPYEQLITERIDSSMFEQEYYHESWYSHTDMPTYENFPPRMDLEQLNDAFPVQCIRKIRDGKYYAMYINDREEHIVVFFSYSDAEYYSEPYSRVTEVLNISQAEDIITVPAEVASLESNTHTMADLLEIAPSLKGVVGANSGYFVHVEGTNTVTHILLLEEGHSTIYGVVDDSGNVTYPVDYDADPQKVILKFGSAGSYSQVLWQDYPQK